MYLRHPLLWTAVLLAGALGVPAGAAEPDTVQADERTLKETGLGTDLEALRVFFRQRTLREADAGKVPALVRQLGDNLFDKREQAQSELIAFGPAARGLLQKALSNPDLEIARRAEQCLKQIGIASSPAVTAAAIRLLAHRKAAEAAEILLAFAPSAGDDFVTDEVRAALTAVVQREPSSEKLLVEALEDKQPARRVVAAEALLRAGVDPKRPSLRKLLQDSDLVVRLRLALALVEAKDKDALPALIALLDKVPREHAWRAEELLCRIAGDQAPAQRLGGDDAAAKECRAAWDKWWAAHGAKLDLAKLDLSQRLLGYTLIVERSLTNVNDSRVLELGPDKKPRWEVGGLVYPLDAQALPGDRVLVAEYSGRRVTERNLKGDILWQKTVTNFPTGCQRLPNGNTFITCRNQLLEVNPAGQEVFSHSVTGNNILAAQRLADGRTVFLTNAGVNGTITVLDAKGKVDKSFNVSQVHAAIGGACFDVLPNGRILVPHFKTNKVVEYDLEGRAIWEAAAQQPTCAMRLPNGNTLISSMLQQRVVELDRTGKEVWDYTSNQRVSRVRRR